jgi:hypothetical protein
MKKYLLHALLLIFFDKSLGQIKYTQPIITPINTSEKQFNGADFNKDSIMDIVTYSDLEGENYLKFYQGNIDGSFSIKDSVIFYCSASFALQPNRMKIADYDNDGNVDVAFLCGYSSSDTIHIYKGNSNFNFIKSADIPTQSSYFPPWLQYADINNDGNLDFAFANSVNNDNIIFILNNGGFNFQPSTNFNGQGNSKNAIFDFINQDTLIDLVTINFPNNTLNIFYNDGLNSFTLDTSIVVNIGGIPTISVNDFDNNNRKDFVIYEANNFVTTIITQSNTGIFNLATMQTNPNVNMFSERNKMITSDINRDGIIDLAICQDIDYLQIYLGDGTGSFTPFANRFNGFGGLGYESGKINQDNSIDFVSLMPGTSSNSLQSLLSLPGNLESINFSPQASGTCGLTSITFFGIGIYPKMHLKFTATGQPDIEVPDSNVTYKGPNTFKANVDFSTATIGKYNVVLTDSNGIETTITEGFAIEQCIEFKPQINIIGPDFIRTNTKTRFIMKIVNNSNNDAKGVSLRIETDGIDSFLFKGILSSFSKENLDSLFYVVIDSTDGYDKLTKAYWIAIPSINANSTKYLIFNIVKKSVGEFNIKGSVGDKVNNVLYKNIRGSCLLSTLGCINEFLPLHDCINGVHGVFIGISDAIYTGDFSAKDGIDMGLGVAKTIWDCASLANPALKIGKVANLVDEIMKGYGKGTSCGNAAMACSGLFKNWFNRKSNSRTSFDPNEKIGIGVGDSHWIHNTETLTYGIRFENVDTASAAAQIVILRDTLDMSKVDITTFKPELITIGNHPPIDFTTYKNNQPLLFDMRPTINLIVKIEIVLDSVSGEVKVVYTSLDPITMQLTTDALLGFLPPNINKPDGEGSFYYSIKLKPNLPNNTIINNTANIYFDANNPILTPTWSNTIDILPPTSKMNAIVPNTNDTTIFLSWSGADAQSGIQKYDVMYSDNGGAFQSYVTNFANDSIRFNGKVGSTYSFYTIAIDNVGNREVKTNGEVTAKINEQDVQIFPNPSNGEFTVQTKNDIQVSSLSLFNLQGQKIPITYKKVNNTFKVQAPHQQNLGNYILKIITKDKTISRKITIEK